MTNAIYRITAVAATGMTLFLAQGAAAQQAASMTAAMADASGKARGTVTATPAAAGGTLLKMELQGLPPGTLAVHVHETGSCEGPDFQTAGGHIAGEHQHGVMHPEGAHPGDLPNLQVTADGSVTAEMFATQITPELLTDADGAAVVVHAGPDDYSSQPAGNSGDRIACGVLTAQ